MVLRDLGSTNGTLVNGTRVMGERNLVHGDRIQIGPLVFEIAVEDLRNAQPLFPTDASLPSLETAAEVAALDDKPAPALPIPEPMERVEVNDTSVTQPRC
jgi:predicted component of type VI protein secretion system